MTDYRFEGLSPRSFEHLVQSLAVKVLGPGCGVWGDGPDGGRELTFDGLVTYSRASGPWDGYGVLQAKFRQRPGPDDGSWAIDQLRRELDRVEASLASRPAPTYYLFVTNAVLTPASGSGSKDKALALLEERSGALGLIDYDIWDFDKLRTYIDDAADIRRAYRAWITPGDLLSDLIDGVESERQRVERAISRFLQKECLAAQYANLEQAGTVSDERVPIAKVFVDLPLETSVSSDDTRTVLSEITALAEQRHAAAEAGTSSRLVVVGGPGQGKSTVGQFACQLLRAALLSDRLELTSPEVRAVVKSVAEAADALVDGLPRVRRLPFHVALSAFAEELATKRMSLVQYLAERVAGRATSTFDVDDMNVVLRDHPVLLVLDGLDEVPSSSNRERVLEAIQDFWTDVASLGADVVCMATTRPQGYSRDFEPLLHRHVTLAALSTEQSLAYGARLVRTRFAGEDDRVATMTDRLERASADNVTARLMRTPLQVTIMTFLLNARGNPPRDRWSLFAEYYDVIYKREVERNNELALVLREHKVDIDAIHAQVGLVLQVASELAGTTQSRMSSDLLRRLVVAHLSERGHADSDVDQLTEQILVAANQRLVFLVGPEEGEVGFEIRSLQEYMAAKALMAGPDAAVRARLERIAALSNWRNVFLFAVGKAVVDQEHMLKEVHLILRSLVADQGVTLRTSSEAAVLAVDIIEDGSVVQHPEMHRRFYEVAADGLGDVATAFRLARVTDLRTEDLGRACIERVLSAQTRAGDLYSLILAVGLDAAVGDWTTTVLSDGRTISGVDIDSGMPAGVMPVSDSAVAQGLLVASSSVGLVELGRRRRHGRHVKCDLDVMTDALDGLHPGWPMHIELGDVRLAGQVTGVVDEALDKAAARTWLDGLGAAASSLGDVVSFIVDPGSTTLATALRAVAADTALRSTLAINRLPWPLSELAALDEDSGLVAQRVDDGAYGDLADWLATERRWLRGPLVVTDGERFVPWVEDPANGGPAASWASLEALDWGAADAGVGALLDAIDRNGLGDQAARSLVTAALKAFLLVLDRSESSERLVARIIALGQGVELMHYLSNEPIADVSPASWSALGFDACLRQSRPMPDPANRFTLLWRHYDAGPDDGLLCAMSLYLTTMDGYGFPDREVRAESHPHARALDAALRARRGAGAGLDDLIALHDEGSPVLRGRIGEYLAELARMGRVEQAWLDDVLAARQDGFGSVGAFGIARRWLGRQSSGLVDRQVWRALSLPDGAGQTVQALAGRR